MTPKLGLIYTLVCRVQSACSNHRQGRKRPSGLERRSVVVLCIWGCCCKDDFCMRSTSEKLLLQSVSGSPHGLSSWVGIQLGTWLAVAASKVEKWGQGGSSCLLAVGWQPNSGTFLGLLAFLVACNLGDVAPIASHYGFAEHGVILFIQLLIGTEELLGLLSLMDG